MAIIIPQSSTRKIALLCAEANSLRKSIESLGSSALKFDSALSNSLDTIIDACNQFNKGIELAKSAGDLIVDSINGVTSTAATIKSAISKGVTNLPTLPLSIVKEIGTILTQVVNAEFEQINTDLLFDQLTKFAPDAFGNVIKKINRIPVELRTVADDAANVLAKTINFNSVLNSTKTSVQKKAITCVMSGSKEKLAETNKLLAQETQNILTNVNTNLKRVAPSPTSSGNTLNGLPFAVTELPGLNADGANVFTLAGNLTGVTSAIFYIEMACEMAKIAKSAINVVNDLIERFQDCMPTDDELKAILDKAVRNQLNQFLKDLTGLSISELERLKEECSALGD